MDITDFTVLAGMAAIAQFAAAGALFLRNRLRERAEDRDAVYEIVIKRPDGSIESIRVPPEGRDLDAFLAEVEHISDKDQVGMFKVSPDRLTPAPSNHSLHGV